MQNKLKSRLHYYFSNFEAYALRKLLRKIGGELYIKDRFGLISKRELTDNFRYMLYSGNPCDSAPLMDALSGQRFDVAFDIGANIGLVTSFLAARSRVVYAFEPEPRNLKRCREQLRLNLAENVQLFDIALSDYEGSGQLHLLKSFGHHSLGPVTTSAQVGTIPVRTTTLDKFCDENKIDAIDFLKVDVEGFELEVFKGGERMLRRNAVKLIGFEISEVPLRSLGKSGADVLALLRSYGYEIVRLNGDLLADSPDFVNYEDFFARPNGSGPSASR